MVEAVVIATTPDSHLGIDCRRSLPPAKKFCEKPVAFAAPAVMDLQRRSAAAVPRESWLSSGWWAVVIATSPDSHVALIAARCRRQKEFCEKPVAIVALAIAALAIVAPAIVAPAIVAPAVHGTGVCGTGSWLWTCNVGCCPPPSCKLAFIGALVHLLTCSKRL
ncbi:MAG: hypothetical protein ACNYPI_07630 [Arenicellales bacterium WSBS_2016_MAG_OTU3]